VIWGYCQDETAGDGIRVTLIATGFNTNPDTGMAEMHRPEKQVTHLDEDVPTMITQPITNPLQSTLPHAEPPMPRSEPQVVEEEASEPYLKQVDPSELTEQTILDFVPPAVPPAATPHRQESVWVEDRGNSSASSKEEQKEEKTVFQLDGDEQPEDSDTPFHIERKVPEDHQTRVTNRLSTIRENSLKLRTPGGLTELEKEPAYKRKNVDLTSVPHSSESEVSRYTLSEEQDESGERSVELKRNNPFLHDNVD
jgi:cell division protein FtsZ